MTETLTWPFQPEIYPLIRPGLTALGLLIAVPALWRLLFARRSADPPRAIPPSLSEEERWQGALVSFTAALAEVRPQAMVDLLIGRIGAAPHATGDLRTRTVALFDATRTLVLTDPRAEFGGAERPFAALVDQLGPGDLEVIAIRVGGSAAGDQVVARSGTPPDPRHLVKKVYSPCLVAGRRTLVPAVIDWAVQPAPATPPVPPPAPPAPPASPPPSPRPPAPPPVVHEVLDLADYVPTPATAAPRPAVPSNPVPGTPEPAVDQAARGRAWQVEAAEALHAAAPSLAELGLSVPTEDADGAGFLEACRLLAAREFLTILGVPRSDRHFLLAQMGTRERPAPERVAALFRAIGATCSAVADDAAAVDAGRILIESLLGRTARLVRPSTGDRVDPARHARRFGDDGDGMTVTALLCPGIEGPDGPNVPAIVATGAGGAATVRPRRDAPTGFPQVFLVLLRRATEAGL